MRCAQEKGSENGMESIQEIHRRRWLIFIAVVLTTFMNCMDGSSVSVALPSMADELGVTMADIEWVVTAYTLVIICFILVFGRLGDTLGQDRIFKLGVTVFLVGAVVCFLSQTYVMLLIGRVIEGVGSAATMANNQGIIVKSFPIHERGKALGFSGSSVALGTMVGPSVGGFVVYLFDWNAIFALDIPIVLLCLYLSCKYLPDLSTGKQEKMDVQGALLFMVMILCVYGSVKLLQAGASYYLYCFVLFVCMLFFGYLFVRWERRRSNAMLDLHLFENKLFAVSIFCAFLSFFSISGHNFIQPFYLQKVQLLDTAHTGLLMMAYSITMCVMAPLSGYLSDKIGSEFLCFVGLCINTLSALILSTLGVDTSLIVFVVGSMVMALGMAMFQSPNTSLIMSTVGRENTGIAGSINGLARNLGMVFGISFSTVLLYNIMSSQLGYTVMSYVDGQEAVFVAAMQWAYRFMALISAVGAILTGLRWKKRKADAE